jgi:hypothetical protein
MPKAVPFTFTLCTIGKVSMISRETKIRIARPTDNLVKITAMYINGLGFKVLGEFKDHEGFSGSIIGHEKHNFHIEFTHHQGAVVGKAPTQDNLLVFYLPKETEWLASCALMEKAGFKLVISYNPYWELNGKTFEDLDGYRIVLQKSEWIV